MFNPTQHIFHLVLYHFIQFWRSISWRFSGIYQHLTATKNGEKYATSGQLLKVWSRSRDQSIVVLDLHMFITSHVGFVHPEYALQKHVTLMTVTNEHAIFCVPNVTVDLHDTNEHPFLLHALFNQAEHLLVIPIKSFIKLSESTPDTNSKVLWIYHPGRCGSTALAQAFNALPDVQVVSEPSSIFSLFHTFCDSKISLNRNQKMEQEYRKLFHCTVQMTLKPALKAAKLVVVKVIPRHPLNNIKLLTELFPDFKVLFMYRDVAQQCFSYYRAIQPYVPPPNRFITALTPKAFQGRKSFAMTFCGCFMNKKHVDLLASKEKIELITLFESIIIGWAENCYHYREIVQRQKSYIPSIKYEHMVSNLESHLNFLFQYLGLTLAKDQLEIMKEALSHDSQKSSHISKEVCSRNKVIISPQMIHEANECLEYYGLPLWGEKLVLPHTISD